MCVDLTAEDSVEAGLARPVADARKRRKGAGLWRTFWYGDTVDGGGSDERSPRYPTALSPAVGASAWGMSLPFTLVASTAIGVWLALAPLLIDGRGWYAVSSIISGLTLVALSLRRGPVHERYGTLDRLIR